MPTWQSPCPWSSGVSYNIKDFWHPSRSYNYYSVGDALWPPEETLPAVFYLSAWTGLLPSGKPRALVLGRWGNCADDGDIWSECALRLIRLKKALMFNPLIFCDDNRLDQIIFRTRIWPYSFTDYIYECVY
jgi:hypothetical protein